MLKHSDRDWTQDFLHNNGNYECICVNCREHFHGYKRRSICFKCANNIDHETPTRVQVIEILEKYNKLLMDGGYCDIDILGQEPHESST